MSGSWFISFDKIEVKDTRSNSEMGAWNLLAKRSKDLSRLSIRSLEMLGYSAKQDKQKGKNT